MDCSGSIDATELLPLLRSLRVPCKEEEAALLVRRMDADGSGAVEYDEFARWFHAEGFARQQRQRRAAVWRRALPGFALPTGEKAVRAEAITALHNK